MIPFVEPTVYVDNEKLLLEFDTIASRLGITGYVVCDFSIKKGKKAEKQESVEHFSRKDTKISNLNKVKNFLSKERNQCELLSVTTTNAKIAQWVVKDNRVDILSIPVSKIKEIITEQLANVAAANQTFLEIDLSSIIHSTDRKSIILHKLTRVMRLILKQRAPFIFTTKAKDPFGLRDMRSIIALGNLIGVPEQRTKDCMKAFYERIQLNKKKLSDEFITTGIWKKNKKQSPKETKKKKILDVRIESDDLPVEFIKQSEEKRRLDRQRYILFEILSEKKTKYEKKQIEDLVWKEIGNHFGSVGSSRIGMFFSYFSLEEQFGIIRCTNHSLQSIRAVFSFITNIEDEKVLFHIMKVSGTIRSLVKIAKKKEKK
ncbi:MAG: RNase P subunit p30 family protein [Candidatus Heimdallarchaeota archaeon]